METSAKTGKNVTEAFHAMVRAIREWRESQKKKDKKISCTLL